MYINRLHLKAFGKFINRKIDLQKGLNIFYGENEAGKSTIHNFIESVMYNFDEDKKGQDLKEKYRPWESDIYKGSIDITSEEDRIYSIGRDFLTDSKEITKRFIDEEGNQIYESMNIKNPGEYFFNMNKASYINTVSIKQLGNKTDDNLLIELKNKIINLSNSRDEDICIERLLLELDKIKEQSGSEDDSKTLLGQCVERLKELENEKRFAKSRKNEVVYLSMEKKKMLSKAQNVQDRIDKLKDQRNTYTLYLQKERFLKAEKINNEICQVEEELRSYNMQTIKSISESSYMELDEINKNIISMTEQRNKVENENIEKLGYIEKLQNDIANKINKDFSIEKINKMYDNYKSNNYDIKDIHSKISDCEKSISHINIKDLDLFLAQYNKIEKNNLEVQLLKIDANTNSKNKLLSYRKIQKIKRFIFLLMFLISFVVVLASTYGGYIGDVYMYVGLISIFPCIYFLIQSNKKKNMIRELSKEISFIENNESKWTKISEVLIEENEDILERLDCLSSNALKEKYKEIINLKSLYEQKSNLIKEYKEKVEAKEEFNIDIESKILLYLDPLDITYISDENIKIINDAFSRKDKIQLEIEHEKELLNEINQYLNKLNKEIQFEEKRFDIILKANNVESMEEFRKLVEYKENYFSVKNKKQLLEDQLDEILETYKYEELKEQTKNINLDEKETDFIDLKECDSKVIKLYDEKSTINENMNNIDREIEKIENEGRNIAEIIEEIEFYEHKKLMIIEKIKIAELTTKKIIDASDSIKGDFMPLLRKSISDNFEYLTGGKYKEVVIADNMDIYVLEGIEKKKVELENLSGGTLDQFHLSLRMGLSNILSENRNIPIIFDDSFVQYDEQRLKNSIEILGKESERRQIVLFTCQEREVEYAKQSNIKFNFIKL